MHARQHRSGRELDHRWLSGEPGRRWLTRLASVKLARRGGDSQHGLPVPSS